MNVLALLGLGLALGLRHAADPDHVVAVAALTARTRRMAPAALLGAVWGVGHAVTLFAVGAGIIVFNWVVPPRIGLSLELLVGLALVVVGLLNLRAIGGRDEDSMVRGAGRLQAGRAFAVGMAHGLAGSAAVALLVLATVRDPWQACAYLLVFASGTLIGMTLITASIAVPAGAVGRWPGMGEAAPSLHGHGLAPARSVAGLPDRLAGRALSRGALVAALRGPKPSASPRDHARRHGLGVPCEGVTFGYLPRVAEHA